ncbi:MAG: RDD family protein [Planctomycetota bacterium]
MTNAYRTQGRCTRPGRFLRGLCLILTVAALAAPAGAQTQPARWRTLIAANEQSLWLARVDRQTERSELFRRTVTGGFEPRPPLARAMLTSLAPSGATLYAFMEKGAFYSLVGEQWTRERDLPRRILPQDLLGGARGVYALIPSPRPAELARALDGQSPESQPFDPGGAPLTIARYDTQEWRAVTSAPADLEPRAPCRLGHVGGTLALFLLRPDGAMTWRRYDATEDKWLPLARLPAARRAADLWFTHINSVPAVVYTVADGGVPEVRVLRHFGGAGGAGEWRDTELVLAALPAEPGAGRYAHADGFNQHAVLLLETTGDIYLRFGTPDEPPAERTISVNELLQQQLRPTVGLRWFQYLTPLVVAVVLAALFLLRRNALRAPLRLPAQYAVALSFQRLGGLILDLGLIGLGVALVTGVNWQQAAGELFTLAIGTDAKAWPARETWVWWGITGAIYTVYSLIMELTLGRTVGKIAVGTRVLADTGTPPRPWQVVVRNAVRLLELAPPLWLLAFLVVLSQNRQRLGDIFARTVVVRRLRDATAP